LSVNSTASAKSGGVYDAVYALSQRIVNASKYAVTRYFVYAATSVVSLTAKMCRIESRIHGYRERDVPWSPFHLLYVSPAPKYDSFKIGERGVVVTPDFSVPYRWKNRTERRRHSEDANARGSLDCRLGSTLET